MNRFRPTVKKKLEKENNKYQNMDGILPRQQRQAKALALTNLFIYVQEAFNAGQPLHARPKDVVYSIQCPSPPGFEGSGFTRLACALGHCLSCPKYKQPEAEVDNPDLIRWHDFLKLPTCTKCGSLPVGTTSCPLCPKRFKKKKLYGKIKTKLHLAFDEKPFSIFWPIYEKFIKKYTYHRWKFLVLGKKNIIDNKNATLRVGDVAFQHDFTEALSVIHNKEVCVMI